MPTYSFIDTDSGEEFDALMKISEREEYLKSNPHIQPLLTAAAIVGGVSIKDKVPAGFKEVLAKVAENHKGSAVADAHGKRSIKETKTKRIVESLHKKKYGK
jgi:predicted nucleic acid-binding Zn ribbon protein